MSQSEHSNITNLTIYKKSLDVFKLCRHIAAYVTNDKDIIAMHVSKNHIDKYADKLVMDALGLIPKIVETENETNSIKKLKHAKDLRFFIDRLYYNTKYLNTKNTNSTDFIKLLRIEIKKLRIIHKQYVRSLVQKN
ncbi:hypothetical protein FNB79_07925 [Formosa sediminum]|uniref:Four helix bundle protein n=1 Tax=Formosa sediminum TaxID=2594004 RepID=A0A516GQV1_9FLAO|nr:hypothetical protein [Formosa sediminum]QDO93914.1 hypothetical protein FNB79_07925 [Formosa sediminum]